MLLLRLLIICALMNTISANASAAAPHKESRIEIHDQLRKMNLEEAAVRLSQGCPITITGRSFSYTIGHGHLQPSSPAPEIQGKSGAEYFLAVLKRLTESILVVKKEEEEQRHAQLKKEIDETKKKIEQLSQKKAALLAQSGALDPEKPE